MMMVNEPTTSPTSSTSPTSGSKRVPANLLAGNKAFWRRPRHNLEAHRRLDWADPGDGDGGVLEEDNGDGDGDGLETNQLPERAPLGIPREGTESRALQPSLGCQVPLSNTIIASFRKEYKIFTFVLSESIPALGWVTVSPAPAPFVLEMFNAGQFYTNRFLSIRSNENVQLLDQVDDVLRQGAEGLQGQGRHPCGVGEGLGPMSCRASGSTKWCKMMMTMMVNAYLIFVISFTQAGFSENKFYTKKND